MKPDSIRRYSGPCFGMVFSQRLASIGVSVTDTNSDTSTPEATTTANELNRRPIRPDRNTTGAKIATRLRVAAITANTTCWLPSMAACIGSVSPSSRRRQMFSITTMASSTTTPISSSRASRVMVLKV